MKDGRKQKKNDEKKDEKKIKNRMTKDEWLKEE